MNRLAATLCGLILAALPSTSALADTVYTYTGNPYTFIPPGGPFTQGEFISGSFTLSSPLAPNMAWSVITPTQFSFSDGPATFTETNTAASLTTFDVATDGTGNIVSWAIDFVTSNLENGGGIVMSADEAFVGLYGSGGYEAFNTNDPGTWSTSTSDAPVPEPSGLLMLGTGTLAGLGALRRKLLA